MRFKLNKIRFQLFLGVIILKKCIFLDRDGNINVEKEYLYKPEDFEFETGAKKAIKIFKELGYIIVVVTNQSGVARGYYGESDVEKLHEYINKELEEIGVKVDAFYYCPHHPTKGTGEYLTDCMCRKPELGMFEEARKDLDIDYRNSIIVGDKISDVEVGLRLGMRPVLVRTGHGAQEEKKRYFEFEVYDTLYKFAEKLKQETE